MSNPHHDAIATNRAMWDDRVEAHWKSAMYRRDAMPLDGGHAGGGGGCGVGWVGSMIHSA